MTLVGAVIKQGRMRFVTRAAPWIFVALAGCSRDESVTGRADATDESLAVLSARELRGRVQALHAKAVLVNAWATWCDSCEHELPILQKLEERFAPQGVRVILVSVDEPEQKAQIRTFLAERGIRLTSYVAAPPLDAFKAGMNPRWPGMLPASFLFDDKGKLRYFWGGEAFEKELVPVVEGFLAGQHIDGESRFDVAPEGPNRSSK